LSVAGVTLKAIATPATEHWSTTMTFRDSPWSDGTPCWVDLMVPGRKAAMEFYAGLFGWELEEGGADSGFYTMASLDGRHVAGIGEPPAGSPPMPAAWTTYLATSDVDKSVEALLAAGGQVYAPAMDVMTHGRMAIVADPTGAVFGLWQSRAHTGFQVANQPGADSWNECMTRDFEAAKAFYSSVFGYTVEDISMPGFSYATLHVDGSVVGGLGALPHEVPGEVPAHWGTYFSVGDTDAAMAKAVELGGSVMIEPFDSPQGRIAGLVDTQGAAFRVISLNPA
jgi:predicted enzyme related to lactoylglutathione lyase